MTLRAFVILWLVHEVALNGLTRYREDMMMDWFTESASETHRLQWRISDVLYQGRSPYQTIQVLETAEWGRCLILDGIMQTTTGDEFIYHEMLAYVPLNAHPQPEDVLIIGGGDGGLAREVLRIPTVRRVTLVEIDRLVTEVARQYLPELASALDDPRVTVIYADGAQYLEDSERRGSFDAILVDSTDPEGTGPGNVLYTDRFHRLARQALKPGGMFAQQTGVPFYNPDVVRKATQELRRLYPEVGVFWCTIPTYPGGLFTFAAGSLGNDLSRPVRSPGQATRWYTPELHRQAFVLPAYLQKLVRD